MLATLLTNSGDGFLYRADTRVKMGISVMASIMTLVLNSPESQLILFAFTTLYALSMRRPLLLFGAQAIVLMIMVLATGFASLINAMFPMMPAFSLVTMFVPFLRLAVMVNVILPLAFTSRLQSMLTALKSLHLSFYLYIPLAVMIRFIPTFIFDFRQMAEALRIRGYKLGFKQFLRHPLLTMRLLTLPLLFRSLKTSEDLGIAAELKGLGVGQQLRPYRALVWKRADTLLFCAALLVCVTAMLCHWQFGTVVQGVMR